ERCRKVAEKFPKAVVVNALANDVTTIKEEGIDGCDTFLALTGSSEKNIVSCMVAREHGVRRTLARIEELQYIPEAESLSIDKIINKKLLNTGKVLNVVLDTNVATTQCLSLDKAEVTEIKAPEGARIVSRPISELSLPRGVTVAGLVRDGKGQLVEGRTRIMPGDHVVIFSVSGSIARIEKLFR
ncbi:MAG: NAD-binding protein, partial [Muribaculaceae bacterium]|nr:NAD-binding protein [Muribaculaceae bacterium]